MDAYRKAGVDLSAAADAVDLIRKVAAGATREEVAESVGGFAGLFRIGGGRMLAAATDGAGTKTEIARLTGRYDTIGIDLVAMSVNDVICTGAEPLFFLDTVVVGRVVPERVASIVEGVAEGCRQSGCALLGGETAEHPGLMEPDEFDLTGFCVGVVQEDELIGPHRVEESGVLIGLASSGLHANGYSLVRKVLLEEGRYRLDERPEGLARSLADELLEPTRIYAKLVRELVSRRLVHAAAHITGGGLVENILRALPEGLGAEVDTSAWAPPPIFELLRDAAGLSDDELFRTFNMGIGMVLVVSPDAAGDVISRAATAGCDARAIGAVKARPSLTLRD